jgi:hypothetical protein
LCQKVHFCLRICMYCMPPICSFLCTLYYPRTYFCLSIAQLLLSGHVLSKGNTFGAAGASIGITRSIYVMILMSCVTFQILNLTLISCTRPTHTAPPPTNVVLLCYLMVVVVCSNNLVRVLCVLTPHGHITSLFYRSFRQLKLLI